ncbi:hypothetical protein ABG768_003025 [Culter alburnus]|uniref:Gypsy retrotransposon integrase-like protein 1 n=2 Tax=Culter alburnus TaxID=194366 RepID=A0AAW2A4R3_CULAL
MSTELLEEVQSRTKRSNGTFKLQRCELNLQAYSHTGLQLKHVAPIHLTVGPMNLVHPVYVSPLNTYPLLIGKDLLNRFEPLIDFKHLKIWTQVREPLPLQSVNSSELQCQATDTAPHPLTDDASSKPRASSTPSNRNQDPFLCSLQASDSDSGSLRIMTAINVQDKDLNDQTDALAKAAITRHQHTVGAQTPASSHVDLSPQFTADDLLTLQASDPTLQTIAAHLSDPITHPISTSDLSKSYDLRHLHSIKHMLHLKDGVLTYVPEPLTAPKLVVPQSQRGMMLTHAHDAPCAGHHGAKATYETLKQVAYWPGMQQDVTEYVKGCLVWPPLTGLPE